MEYTLAGRLSTVFFHHSGQKRNFSRYQLPTRYNRELSTKNMLVDVHSHLFRYPEHFSKTFIEQARRARNQEFDLTVRWEEYHARALACDKTIVFGGKARLSGLWVPDQEVSAYVRDHADKLIGFLSLDPTQTGWQDELHEGHQNLKLKGIKLMS